jgi:hypothetical protein
MDARRADRRRRQQEGDEEREGEPALVEHA